MAKAAAPWIHLTTDKPGLDNKHRNAINEWCGAVGKNERLKNSRRKVIRFSSRAVNWQTQSQPNSNNSGATELLHGVEGVYPPEHLIRLLRGARANVNTDGRYNRAGELLKSPSRTSQRTPSKQVSTAKKQKSKSKSKNIVPTVEPMTAFICSDGKGLRVDPFGVVPGTSDDPKQAEILDYYMQVLDPGVIATFFIFDMRSTYGKLPLEFMTDEEFKPLGLASIAGTMNSVKHRAITQEYIFEQLGKGMAQLRGRLEKTSEPNGDVIVISVLFLASLAHMTHDMDGFAIHRKHLKQMVDARGGLDELGNDGGTKTTLLQWDASWKLSLGDTLWIQDRPKKEPAYAALPLNKEHADLVNRLPSGFRDLCKSQTVTVDLMQTLARTDKAMSYRTSREMPYDQKAGHCDDYLDMASLQNLASLDKSVKDSPRLLEALLILSIILFSSTAFNDIRTVPVIFRGPRDALWDRLMGGPSVPAFWDEAQEECYQWVWAIAIDVWRDAARDLPPEGHKLLDKFHETYAATWKTTEGLINMLKRFWWTEDLVSFHESKFDEYLRGSKSSSAS